MGIERFLARFKSQTNEEQHLREEKIAPMLSVLEAEAIDILSRLRKKADDAVLALPGKIRPSKQLRKRFPLVLGILDSNLRKQLKEKQ